MTQETKRKGEHSSYFSVRKDTYNDFRTQNQEQNKAHSKENIGCWVQQDVKKTHRFSDPITTIAALGRRGRNSKD